MLKKWTVAGLIWTLSTLTVVTVVHDTVHATEDSRIVWLCGIHGDGTCAPQSSPVIVRPDRLLWW